MEASRIMGIKDGLRNIRWVTLVKFASMALFGAWSLGFAWILLAEPARQKTFSSPDEASRALIRAVQSGNEKELLEIFGTDGKEIISSGDKVEDQKSRDAFAEKYQRMNRLVKEPDGTVRLYVGAENWPMPIPLVNWKDTWYFDLYAQNVTDERGQLSAYTGLSGFGGPARVSVIRPRTIGLVIGKDF